MTLSSQLGASLVGAAPPAQPLDLVQGLQGVQQRRARKTGAVATPSAPDTQDAVPRWRRKLSSRVSSLIRSTGDLSAQVHAALDETAVFVRTLSQRRQQASRRPRARGDKLKSRWVSYTDAPVDEETAAALHDDETVSVFGDDGCSSGTPSRRGSTLSLAEDGLDRGGAAFGPLRRTLSCAETPCEPGVAVDDGVRERAKSVSHAEFRHSMGSIPVEYAASLVSDGLRRQHCPRNGRAMHSAWSTSLTSLKEGVIADDLGHPGDLRHAPGLRRSHDSVRHSQYDSGFDEVDAAPAPRPHRDAIDAPPPIAGGGVPVWTFLDGGFGAKAPRVPASGSLPALLQGLREEDLAADPSSDRTAFYRSLSISEKARFRCSITSHGQYEERTRSRSLTHIAALDMSGDGCRPDRLVVPPAGEACHSLRRQKLTSRSQLSSSEYFLVTFEVAAPDAAPDAVQPDEEYIVAAKGTTLEEALTGPCLKRGITLSSVSVLLEGCRVDLNATSLHTECSLLAGKQLRIRAKQDEPGERAAKGRLSRASSSQQPSLRKSSGSVRSHRRYFSTSTEDPSFSSTAPVQDLLGPERPERPESLGKAKASKQRWSGFFGQSKDTKIESLTEQLDNYTKHGIPQLPGQDVDERLYQLEGDWRELVENSESLAERLQQQQDAVWELLQTELAYIRTLTVVKDLFLACLSSLQDARLLTDVDKGRLFSNIVDIHAANAQFWELYLAPLVAATRGTRLPFNPHHLLDGFLKFDEVFCPYVQYCVEQAECQKYCRERTAEGELFTVYLAWCETQGACNRLRLVDILVKPMQRLTKYSLLLKAILKKTDCEEQRHSLEFMIRKVDEFVNSVNSKLRERQDHDRLKSIIARIDTYDIVESKDEDLEKMVRLHSDLDLTRPMPNCPPSQRRYLLLEGDLRLRDLNNSKVDVHCFLLTDMLLVCKTTTKKTESRMARVRVLRPPYLVERLVVQELPRDPPTLACVYLNEYKVATTAFLLSSSETKLVKSWHDSIRKAQGLYAQAKQTAGSSPCAAPVHQYHAPPLSLSRQPSSLYDEDLVPLADEAPEVDTHSYTSYSLGLYPQRSPRGSTRGSSLNHSHSGSVEMNEASSLSSATHSRGISVDNNELRASSLSSDEGIPPIGADQAAGGGGGGGSGRGLRRSTHSKSPSPNTLSIQVPVFSSLGQSLPNLNLAASSPHGVPQPPSSLLLVPPTGKHQHHGPLSPGHRGTSYPPPSPPRGLHRGLALAASRNPPLMKMRHVSSVGVSCAGPAPQSPPQGGAQAQGPGLDLDVPQIAGAGAAATVSPSRDKGKTGGADGAQPCGPAGPRQAFMMKRLARGDNRRYHTAGTVDDVKKAEGRDARDASIQKRFSWNYGPGGGKQAKRLQQAGYLLHDDQQDVLLIDRATSPLEPPPQHITDAAWSHMHSGSTERNPFAEPVVFQSPSVGSSPSVSLCGDCPPGPPVPPSVTSSPALSASSPVQLPSLNTSPTTLPSPVPSAPDPAPARSSNPFLDDAVQDPACPAIPGPASDEVLVLITDAHSEYTDV